ncbi:MAG: hypothetical protein A2Y73_07320 [Chloroflexi bacterium RBG_13_56_8]|nr:MAG: hypothetical protein A2Y73_07320 [Chloroflexi bacterium RBG_13_56_8]
MQEMLARYYDDFADTLNWLDGKQEWGIKIYANGEALERKVIEMSGQLQERSAKAAEKFGGAAYFERKKLEKDLAEEVERITDEYAQRSHDRLAAHAEACVVNALQSKEVSGREADMALNGAYLVAEERLADFRAELNGLTKEFGDFGFVYESTGPWPPYNFAKIGADGDMDDEPVSG